MAKPPAGRPPEFNPDVTSPRDLRDQPLSVIKTELPALADALGVTPAELFRSLTGEAVQPETERSLRGMREALVSERLEAMESGGSMCCHSDSW